MTLEEINSKFVYKTDKEQFGVEELWTGLQEVDDKLVGDCEDYAITLKNNVEEFKDWDYWYCKLNGTGHCVLVSSDTKFIIDNNCKITVELASYKDKYSITNLKKYNLIRIWYSFSKAYITQLFTKK